MKPLGDELSATGLESVCLIDEDVERLELWSKWLCAEGIPARAFDSALSFLRQSGGGRPPCVVANLMMRATSGVDFLRAINDDPLAPLIIAVAEDSVAMCRDSLRSGAWDFLPLPLERAMLLARVRRAIDVHLGRRNTHCDTIEFAKRVHRLTEREQFVMQRLAAGQKVRQIAKSMGIGFQTVSKHGIRVLAKLEVKSEVELAVRLSQVESLRERKSLNFGGTALAWGTRHNAAPGRRSS